MLVTHQPRFCRRNGYYYYERTLEGQQYSVNCRRKVLDTSKSPAGAQLLHRPPVELHLLDPGVFGLAEKLCSCTSTLCAPLGAERLQGRRD